MPSQPGQGEWAAWEAGDGHQVEYSQAVMEEIRSAAVEGFMAAPHGGVEVGGVLFGDQEADKVRITAQRPLLCEHAYGPGFRLSERDHSGLRELLKRTDEQGLRPVGWYRSRTRSAVELSEEDLLVHRRYFSKGWQVVLVVKPYRVDDTRARFFLLQADGTVVGSEKAEFPLLPYLGRVPRPAQKPGHGPSPAAATAVDATLPEWAPAPAERAGKRGKWAWVALAVLLLDGAGLGVWEYSGGARDPLGLKASETGGQLRISWDRHAATMRRARRGHLTIAEGPRWTRLELTEAQLAEGSVSYTRTSDRVQVHLRVERRWAAPVEERLVFVGEPPAFNQRETPDGRAWQQVQRERDELAAEVQRLRRELRNQQARNAMLEEANRLLRQRLEIEGARKR